jgi:hypothetical protein
MQRAALARRTTSARPRTVWRGAQHVVDQVLATPSSFECCFRISWRPMRSRMLVRTVSPSGLARLWKSAARISRSAPTPQRHHGSYQPTRTSMRRGFASSRLGSVSLRTPSFKDASIFDVSKSSLTVNRREK